MRKRRTVCSQYTVASQNRYFGSTVLCVGLSPVNSCRVPNLRAFFARHGSKLPITSSGIDYKVGELVTWMLPGNLPHIGIVTSKKSKDGKRPLIVHNIGQGPVLDDMLFDFKITGHYRYTGKT